MLFIKFGKRENLEQLKNGIIHFSTFNAFRNDPTTFRGDKLEGKFLLDPCKPLIINGCDFSSLIEKVEISYDTDCPQLSFSASMLSKNNCIKQSDGLFAINESFILEMSQFGDCFLLVDSIALISALKKVFDEDQCGYEYHPLVYIDKNNYELINEHFAGISEERKTFWHLFVKDTSNSYPLQNEWRFIAFDEHNHYMDENGICANVKTDFMTQMPVMDIESLRTLRCSEEYLFH